MRNLSLSFWGQDIPCFDTGFQKSYINACTFSGAYIVRSSQPSTTNKETWWETWNVLSTWLSLLLHSSSVILWWLLCWWCHKDFQRCSVTSLQYYTYPKPTHNMMSLFMYNILYVSFMYAMPRHVDMSWQGTCACMPDRHVLATTQTEYNYRMGCASAVEPRFMEQTQRNRRTLQSLGLG